MAWGNPPDSRGRGADGSRGSSGNSDTNLATLQRSKRRSDGSGSESPAGLQQRTTTQAGSSLPLQPLAAPASSAGWVNLSGTVSTPRLWRYVLPGQEPVLDTGRDTVLLIHGWLGSGVTSVPSSPSGFNTGLNNAAINLATTNRQVLFLDWGQQALEANPSGLAPYKAAGRVNSVAQWACTALQGLASSGRTLTLAGFSLGSYVAAQMGVKLGPLSNLRLAALDPAAAGLLGDYDLDLSNSSPDPVPNLAAAASYGSVAFVVADNNLTIGVAGDNSRAGTAQRSFLVKGFSSGTSAITAHGAIPALYADLASYLAPEAAVTETILAGFRTNQYSNSGGLSGTRLHEGVVTVRNNLGSIARIDGFTTAGTPQTVQFVNVLDSSTPAGSSTSQDTIVSLRDLQLAATASIETLVLGGRASIAASGNAAGQKLIGNAGANRLEAKGGIDQLTGSDGGDSFVYIALSDALVGGVSSLRSFEWITDFDTSQDRIDAPGSNVRSLVNLGSLSGLSDTDLGALLTPGAFTADGAAVFRWGAGAGERWFLGLNNNTPGFDPLQDAILEITNLRGDPLSMLVS